MTIDTCEPGISVLMPTYGQACFIPAALGSLLAQQRSDWELIVVDDGSPDDTEAVVAPFLADPRIRYERLARNVGLGAALNVGLARARAPRIAYLPSDDRYWPDHLGSLAARLDAEPAAALAYSGVRHHYNRRADGAVAGHSLQLVQVMHRRTDARWLERAELVTDDLGRMLWDRLLAGGPAVATGRVTCEWVDHPGQLHKLLREPLGGINAFRQRFAVKHPLRFHSSVGNEIDEVELYRRARERPSTPRTRDGLTILLVGELAYNADRVLALEERGHSLYGLWMEDPHWYNTVGPLPFGHVRDLPRDDWRTLIRALRPDVIYALLNWQAVPFAREVLAANTGVPFVWHFKEGPFICREKGTWQALMDLHTRADGLVYSSPEMREWFATVLPASAASIPSLVVDGDLPRREWFAGEPSPRLSQADGSIHTVVPGRPIGLHPHNVAELAAEDVHLHFYGDFTHGQWRGWIDSARAVAPRHLHLHAHVDQRRWVEEFSRYDAGWLHFFASGNDGDIGRADWDDLNVPARAATLAAAGLPMIQRTNDGARVATQSLARRLGVGVFARDMADLAAQLRDTARTQAIREQVWRARDEFTFDRHADDLLAFLGEIALKRPRASA
ncbi:Glycosyl transferase family 2 [Nannocystis exedens]|uniref:Glycosyl transferase family 2 n=1 Tax=Nannocystis exedens TaxID=54 RepID=A0A1I2HNF0_9BACT|nr:glycosyltransferase family 2 protein [Nannocystis exedens]PCC71995.1 glycosyl transferase [Nannocystis exedens]SFF30357.1 Glycosyl transferase family 2 [Nannocystis exedens]